MFILYIETLDTINDTPAIAYGFQFEAEQRDDITYYCSTCRQAFKSEQNCQQHMKTSHVSSSRKKAIPEPDISPAVYRKRLRTVKKELKPLKSKIDSTVLPAIDHLSNHYFCCNRKYASKASYKCHLRKVHTMEQKMDILPDVDDPDNCCRSCNHQFCRKQRYRAHSISAYKMRPRPLHDTSDSKKSTMVDDSNHYTRSRSCSLSQKQDISSKDIPKPDAVDKKYHCQICNYQTLHRGNYKRHLTIHTKQLRPFIKRPNLNMLPDENDPDNRCRPCNHRFVNKSSYRMHLRKIHNIQLKPLSKILNPDILPDEDDPNHYCRSCNRHFSTRQTYGKHLRRTHNIKRRKPKAAISP
jgi:hypothetical protein